MEEFKKILRKMKTADYIEIGHLVFWKTNKGKFCIDGNGIETACTQKILCECNKNRIEAHDYRVLD